MDYVLLFAFALTGTITTIFMRKAYDNKHEDSGAFLMILSVIMMLCALMELVQIIKLP